MIIQQDRILLLRKQGGGRGERFALPGGAQEIGETLVDALNRECLEEIGTSVAVGELVHVAEFFKLRDTDPITRRHLVEFLFRCDVPPDYVPHHGHRPDKHQLEVVWAELDTVAKMPLFPQYLLTCIPQPHGAHRTLYLGSFEDHASP